MVDTPLQNEWFISEAAWAHGNWFCSSAVAYLVFRTSRPSRPMLVAPLPSLAQLVPQYLQSRGHRHQTVAQRCTVKVIAVIFFFEGGSHYWVKFSFFLETAAAAAKLLQSCPRDLQKPGAGETACKEATGLAASLPCDPGHIAWLFSVLWPLWSKVWPFFLCRYNVWTS